MHCHACFWQACTLPGACPVGRGCIFHGQHQEIRSVEPGKCAAPVQLRYAHAHPHPKPHLDPRICNHAYTQHTLTHFPPPTNIHTQAHAPVL
eukprot:1159577-Pelagomonas_calceolata.AAC.4